MRRREASLRALFYDAVLEKRGVRWTCDLYTAFGKSVALGPVLELGAGTCHVLRALLRSGVDAYGVEIEPAMLARGRKNLLEGGVRDAKSRLVLGDMRDFSHSRRYGAVVLPYNTIALLATQRELLRMLSAVQDHLTPGGEFMFDLVLPLDQEWVANEFQRPLETLDFEGYCMTLQERGQYDAKKRVQKWVQRVSFPDGQRLDIRRTLRYWDPTELTQIFERAGWSFTIPPVDQKGEQINESSRLLIGRLRPAATGS